MMARSHMVGNTHPLAVLIVPGTWGEKLVVVKARLLKSKQTMSCYSTDHHISELASLVQVLE